MVWVFYFCSELNPHIEMYQSHRSSSQEITACCQRILFVFLLLFFSLSGKTQNSYTFFRYNDGYETQELGKISFALDNTNFFRNNEYSGPIATGYTLTGSWFRPKLIYFANEEVKMEFGGHVLKYNGREDYYHLTPWFAVSYKPSDKLCLTLGNLNADENHRLIEPVFDAEHFLTARPESGLQLNYHTKNIAADLWINWEQFILEGDPFQEKFSYGATIRQTVANSTNYTLQIPVTFFGTHQGGQIDTSDDRVRTFTSVTTGIEYHKTLQSTTWYGWGARNYYIMTTGPGDQTPFYDKGHGIYLSAYLETRMGSFTTAYWEGDQFYVPKGKPVFQSVSQREGGENLENTRLIELKYHFDKTLFGNSHLGFMFDYYIDLEEEDMMNSVGLYFTINLNEPFSASAK